MDLIGFFFSWKLSEEAKLLCVNDWNDLNVENYGELKAIEFYRKLSRTFLASGMIMVMGFSPKLAA